MGIYTACVHFAGYIELGKDGLILENPPLVDRAVEVNGKLTDTIKRLSALIGV